MSLLDSLVKHTYYTWLS